MSELSVAAKISRFMGEQEEREAVVDWLRKTADSKPHGTDWRTYYEIADAIESEAHRSPDAARLLERREG
jgi:hypothetical protein